MRRRAKVDANHLDICNALRKMGCSVVSLATIGRGCPDILVATPDGRNHLIEIKCGKNWTMTEDQKLFHATWRAPVLILDSVESAITWINSNGAT